MKTWTFIVSCLFLLQLQGCEPDNTGNHASPEKLPETARTFVFACADGLKFVAQTTAEGKAWLFLPTGTLDLQEAAVGTYLSEGVTFKVDGELSQLDEPGGKHPDCRNDRRQAIWEHAKLNGADFRAIGNEPGWNMEIRQQSKLILVTSYGADRLELDLPSSETNHDARSTLYKISQEGQEVTLTISGESCSDSMSGEKFSSKVELMVNGKVLRGCGRALH